MIPKAMAGYVPIEIVQEKEKVDAMEAGKLAELEKIAKLSEEDAKQKLLLDKDNKNMQNKLSYEQERYRALKLSLIACDDNSMLSTINFEEYGTLDVNKVYGKLAKKFKFDFKIHPPGSSSARNPSPIQKKSHLIRPVVYDFSEVFKKK
jgi:hypothetical protein